MMKKPDLEQKILASAKKNFFKKGYRQTSMDEIAVELGISKKTIYLCFSSKEELLAAVMVAFEIKLSTKIKVVLDTKHLSFLIKLSNVLTLFSENLAKINPLFYGDLRLFAPEIWDSLKNFIHESSNQFLFKLLTEGIDLGFINPRISPSVIVLMYAAMLQSFINPEFYRQGSSSEEKNNGSFLSSSIIQAVGVLYEGILTDKARGELSIS
jgi:AcrR family transcriptional regulator